MTLSFWLWVTGALLLGAILGAFLTILLGGRTRDDEGDVRDLRRELEDYRQEVADHFIGTAERVNDLTRAYKAVYDHLEVGAYRLVGEETLHHRLEDVGDEPVTLSTIGRRAELERAARAAEAPGPAAPDAPAEEPEEPRDA